MFYNWYLRGLYEPVKHQQEKYRHVDPTAIADSVLLDIICELTGLNEPTVISEAIQEIRKRIPGFIWSFEEYFKDLRLELHPMVRDELRRAHYVLHNS